MAGKKKSRKSKKPVSKSAKGKWPKERAVFFRPERLKYVHKIDRPKGCVFCDALASGKSIDSLLLYANEHAMVIMNKFPYNSGHILVLPRRHCGDYLAFSKEEHDGLAEVLRQSIRILTETYKPAGINVGLNLGAVAGAGIPEHIHYHLIPRWAGDTNFFPLISETKVVVETLVETFERLLPCFDKL